VLGSLSGALASERVTEAFKGRLSPDGNRVRRVKAQAGFTARPTRRAVAKAELSEPTVGCRTAEDYRIKVTLGIDSDPDFILGKKSCCPTHSVRVGKYGL